MRDISFRAGCILRIAEGDDNEAVDRLEVDEDALYRTAMFQRLFKLIGGSRFWDVLEEN